MYVGGFGPGIGGFPPGMMGGRGGFRSRYIEIIVGYLCKYTYIIYCLFFVGVVAGAEVEGLSTTMTLMHLKICIDQLKLT